MFLKFRKFVMEPESRGISIKWAGVITLSSGLFWYIRHKLLVARDFPEEKLYLREFPTKEE